MKKDNRYIKICYFFLKKMLFGPMEHIRPENNYELMTMDPLLRLFKNFAQCKKSRNPSKLYKRSVNDIVVPKKSLL